MRLLSKSVFFNIILVIFLALVISYSFFINDINYQENKQLRFVSTINQNTIYQQPMRVINAVGIFPFFQLDLPLIAIIDSGVDLDNLYIPQHNVKQIILDNASVDSYKKHGTMVAGLIISNGNGYDSPGGLLPEAKLLSIQAGTDSGMSLDQLAASIELAIRNGAKVINISAGSSVTNQKLEQSIKSALSEGVIIVAAAGNEGQSKNNYPAAYPGVISVSTLTNFGEPGFNTNYDSGNIYAPGDYILTASPSLDSDESKAWISGSSAATTIVSSLCTIILSQHPNWDSYQIESFLLSTATTKEKNGDEIHILNVTKALFNSRLVGIWNKY